MKTLIIAGSTNVDNMANVFYVANKYFGKIKRIFILDTPEALKEIKKRTKYIHEIIGGDAIVISRTVKDEEVQKIVPQIVSEALSSTEGDAEENVVVDLTNGKRRVTTVLYAAASLSKIQNIFYLFVPPQNWAKRYYELTESDYEIQKYEPLTEVSELEQSSYFELIFYKDEMNNLWRKYEVIPKHVTSKYKELLWHSIHDYFMKRYKGSIEMCGEICENLALRAYQFLKKHKKLKSDKEQIDFAFYITRIRADVLNPLRGKLGGKKDIDQFEKEMCKLICFDNLLESMRVYRNYTHHLTNHVSFKKRDAKLVLDATILLLNQVSENKFFMKYLEGLHG